MLEKVNAAFDNARAWVNEPINATKVFSIAAGITAATNLLMAEPPFRPLSHILLGMAAVTVYQAHQKNKDLARPAP